MNHCRECGSELRESDQHFCEYCGAKLDFMEGTEISETQPPTTNLLANQYIQYGTQSNLYVIDSKKKSKGINTPNKCCLMIITIYLIILVLYILCFLFTYAF